MNKITLLGIDIAKNIFQLHGADHRGKVVLRKKVTRTNLLSFIAQLPQCVIAMEACGGSNYWARQFEKLGHEVKLISPQFVKAYVKSNKNDMNDAEAICEAASRPSMRFVSPKTITQQDIQGIHRVRSRLIQQRTKLMNQTRGLLSEYGIVMGRGISTLKKQLPRILEDAENELTPMSRTMMADLYDELQELQKRIQTYEARIISLYKQSEVCQRIGEIEGIGPITATAVVAAVGNANVFKDGREMSGWLGLVPKQCSSGGKTILQGISKRGDTYLRTLLIHGARAAVKTAERKQDKRSQWIVELKARKGTNKTCVAVANKNARIIWALMTKQESYRKAA